MRYIILVFITTLLSANINDDINIYKAQDAYVKNDLSSTIEYYKKVEDKTDEIKYNLANTLYKQKKYDESISWYSEIANKDMLFKKYHNLGNAYAKLGKLETAIKNYKDALKIQNDKDTRFNLELLQKTKKQQDKKNKNNKNKDNKKKKQNGKDKKDAMDDEDKKDKQTTSNKKQDKIKEKKDNKSNLQDKAKNSKKEQIKKQDANITKEENLQNTEISKLEEKKWSKMLNNRELNTLMIPLKNKGENNEQNIKPW